MPRTCNLSYQINNGSIIDIATHGFHLVESDDRINAPIKEYEEQIAALKKEITTDVVAAVKEALKPAQETEVEKAARLAKENKPKLGMGKVKPVLKANATEEEIAIHLKKMEIFELSETVDPTDIHSVREFQKMAKEIATGKAADGTVPAKKNDAYGSFFKTNQTVSQAQKADGDAEYGDLLLAQMDKEDKERQNLKIA